MALQCTILFAIQIVSLVAALFGFIAGIVFMCTDGDFSFILFIRGLYTMIIALALGCVEVYVFQFFRYFALILKVWGKAIMYFFIGALLFSTHGFGLACTIIYWICAVGYGIVAWFFPVPAPPLLQGGFKGAEPEIQLSYTEFSKD